MSDRAKYAVLKVDDWLAILPVLRQANAKYRCNPVSMPLTDAEVLRLKDITVAPLLHTYASMITSFRELLESQGALSEARADDLQEIADWAHSAAVRSEAFQFRRLPD